MTYISDVEASELIQGIGIRSSEVVDDYGSTYNVLRDGSELTQHCDLTKPLGWEFQPAPAEPSTKPAEAEYEAPADAEE